MLLKEGADVVMIVLRNSNMVVFVWCATYHITFGLLVPGQFSSDTTKAGFSSLNLSQLPNKLFFICPSVSGFCSTVLKFTLQKTVASSSATICVK